MKQERVLTVDFAEWAASGYLPTPTIVESAHALYQDHVAQEIARSDAGAKNLQETDLSAKLHRTWQTRDIDTH